MFKTEISPTGRHSSNAARAIAVVGQLALGIVALLTLYPILFILMTSFKSTTDVITKPFAVTKMMLDNYAVAWKLGHVAEYFLNSAIVTVVTLIFQLVITIMAAYAFGKLRPRGHNALLLLYLTALFITIEMTTVPVFMLLKDLGLIHTRWGLILPYTASGVVMGIYIMTNFVKGLPKEVDEAAVVDGASLFQILIKIDIPLISPVIATVVIINFQHAWSEFYWALIAVKDEALKTLPLGLINFQSEYGSDYGVLAAGLMILTIPVLIVYLYCSKYFIEGVAVGAVKG
ncbi:carbohydrate ABC transporter permease [Cohnella caldifontis]|uniref:carbohydrate ABC transporter permease n=1 Tax=Cohnella caldifontis TaxID=3027471 RepID=UPI0023EC3800|nr:carbohydrate ABC transporter permease [Cohnella sp. YIM B05605]